MDAETPKKKRVFKSKPKQRSMSHMRRNGFAVADVERRIAPQPHIPHGKTIDVWGFGDLLCCRPAMHGQSAVTALVQSCSTDMAAHRWKCYSEEEFYTWRDAGNKVFLQGWALRGPRGGDKRWTLNEEVLSESSFMHSMGFVQILVPGERYGLWIRPTVRKHELNDAART